jgi:diguanylate cyclase (GGDEF)-like protein
LTAVPAPDLHPLLQRQLRRLGLAVGLQPPDAATWGELLRRVGRTYLESEQDRYLLERSQALASTEMGQLHAELRASQARLASLLSLSSDWVWEQDAQGRFTWVSAHEGDDRADLAAALIGRVPMHDLDPVKDDDAAEYHARVAARAPFRNIGCGFSLPSGQACYVRISGQPVFDSGEFRGYRGVGADITDATLAEQQVLHLARFDCLTGVANRSLFLQRLEQKLAQARGVQGSLALLFIDLDRFKAVNDTLGHDAGDDLLKEMARRLTALVRPVDVVARLGGDEFVVLIDDCGDPAVLSKVASRMIGQISEPLRLAGRQAQIGASIGIAVHPADGADAGSLLKSADTAMYQAKSGGRNGFRFFTAELAHDAARHFLLEGELRQAIDRGELRLHYQPKIDLATSRMAGLEALVRWQHPERGLLMPGDFIDLAEESGLIVPLGRWVMGEACRQVRQWREDGLDPPRCAINLSARELTSDSVVADIQEALAAQALEAGALEVEITESALMSEPERAQQHLARLRAMGVRIAIDDFGTGHASLSYLKRFPAGTVKIDRDFVAGLPDRHDDAAIVRAVATLAHSLGMVVVAEGVETARQLDFLRQAGCDQVQGYLTGRPLPAEAMAAVLDTRPLQAA